MYPRDWVHLMRNSLRKQIFSISSSSNSLVHFAARNFYVVKLDSDYSASVMGTQKFFPYLALS